MSLKRVNITIDEKLHKKVHDSGLNLSRIIREKLEDHFSQQTITISVSKEVKHKYDQIVSLVSATDEEFLPYLDKALNDYLKHKKKVLDSRIELLLKK